MVAAGGKIKDIPGISPRGPAGSFLDTGAALVSIRLPRELRPSVDAKA
jgi:hypothetical protein